MIEFLKFGDTAYPFFFGFRAIFAFLNARGIDLEDFEDSISVDEQALLDMYSKASNAGVNKYRKDQGMSAQDVEALRLSADTIEDMIDEDPSVFFTLQSMFGRSQFMKALAESSEETEEKKTQSP